LGSVEPRGRAMTALVSSHWTLLDAEGHTLTRVTGAAGSWTSDGHLVEPAPRGIDVYDIAGKKRSVPLSGAAPLSALGSRQVLLSTATGLQVLDIVAGTHQPIGSASQLLRGATGSPDGARVAYLDDAGAGQVLDLKGLKAQHLPAPALTTGFAWSRDAAWIGVQTVYGGAALRLSDDMIVASGSQVVVSW
ncbi:MAG: hypothetical protein M3010_11145, partial [Candidatus Dormibacteraeota bacterium]|nr:hypothetical protein [Candidatus Dormibacteraeota bacterium]